MALVWRKVQAGDYDARLVDAAGIVGASVAHAWLERPYAATERWTWFITSAGIPHAGAAARWAGTALTLKAAKLAVEIALGGGS